MGTTEVGLSGVIRFNTDDAGVSSTTVQRFDQQGRLRQAKKSGEERSVKEPAGVHPESVTRQTAQPASAAGSIPKIHMVARRYQRHPAVRKLGLSPAEWTAFFQAMIKIESAYKETARSHVGAIGLAQLMPATAKYLRVDPFDPVQNLDGGARYLIEQMETFGSLTLALAAYNAGPKAVEKYGREVPPYRETQGHVVKVFAAYEQLKKEKGV